MYGPPLLMSREQFRPNSEPHKSYADKLQKMQNRAAKILTFSKYEVRSSVLLDELGWERL